MTGIPGTIVACEGALGAGGACEAMACMCLREQNWDVLPLPSVYVGFVHPG